MIIPKDKILNLSKNLSQMNEVKGRSLWQDAKIRFFKNKAALFSLVTLLIVLLFSFIGPFLQLGQTKKLIGVF
jgi:oligopeptide transport system permease protein